MLLVALGCQYKEEKFLEDRAEASCAILVDCFDLYESVESCIETTGGPPAGAEGCTFDPKAARGCAKAWKELECPTDLVEFETPVECDAVYSGCGTDSGAAE